MSAPEPSRISRREALRRAAALSLAGMPFSFTAASEGLPAPWLELDLEPVRASGYGTDPVLINPAPAPWPNTFSKSQRALVAALGDILLPAEEQHPAASAVGVPAVLDEWVSAPYELQQAHRQIILSGLDWCEREARRRHGRGFLALDAEDQVTLVHAIALPDEQPQPELEDPARSDYAKAARSDYVEARAFFELFRRLAVGIYYSSPEGARELGYLGNVPIAGAYPGPTAEAMAHLQTQLDALGLELP